MSSHRLSVLVLLGVSLLPAMAREASAAQELSVGADVTNFEAGGVLGWRWRSADDTLLGLQLSGAGIRRWYIGGFESEGGSIAAVNATAVFPLAERGPIRTGLRLGFGARSVRGDSDLADADALTLTPSFAVLAEASATDALRIVAGIDTPAWVALSPETDVALLGSTPVLGLRYSIAEQWQLVADGRVGGVFGFGGDGAKFIAGGSVGLRWQPGGSTPGWF